MASRPRKRSSTENSCESPSRVLLPQDMNMMSLSRDPSRGQPSNFGINVQSERMEMDPNPDQMSVKSHCSKEEPPDISMEATERRPSGAQTLCSSCNKVSEDASEFRCGHRLCKQCFGPDWDICEAGPERHCPKCGGDNRHSELKQHLRKAAQRKFTVVSEGISQRRGPLNAIYTQLHVSRGQIEWLRPEHESRQIRNLLADQLDSNLIVTLSDIFTPPPSQKKNHMTVLTKGVAGIGKSFIVQKFTLDWAEEKTNLDIDYVFTLAFRDLNLFSGEKNLIELLTEFFPEFRDQMDSLDLTNSIVILDGLDESRQTLQFQENQVVKSIREKTSVGNLIVNLIQGNLLPDSKIWITSRPTAANQIPAKLVDLVTDIIGFSDQQKEEYFRKRFSTDAELSTRILMHIRSSSLLDSMCQIPIFCWISASLFQEIFSGNEKTEVPQTLTEMMAYFVFAQTQRRERAFGKKPKKSEQYFLKLHKEFFLKLGKLAFDQLLKNSLIFYEEDLMEYGIDLTEGSVSPEFFNTILRAERIFVQKQVYFFVHLTIQEFFAALYVYDCLTNKKSEDLQNFLGQKNKQQTLLELLKKTVEKVLAEDFGHLDFFLQFLLGLMVEPNRRILQGLLVPPDPSQDTENKILTHLKSIRRKTISPDSCMNLFQAMVEMRDQSVKQEIEEFLKLADRSSTELSPLHCSALAYMLRVSKDVLEVLDLKTYNTTDEGRRRLIPAVRKSRRAILANCKVTTLWVQHLVHALRFPHSHLRDLDLANNDLKDSGVELLCQGLSSLHCKLETLSLSGCMVSEKGCGFLASALRSNPSHLKVLDLSYNHPGDSGVTQLSELKNDQTFALTELKIEPSGSQWLIPGCKKYACDVTLDPLSKDANLLLSDNNRKVTWIAPMKTSESHRVVTRLDQRRRYYLEMQVEPSSSVGLAYPSVSDKEKKLGSNDESWCFISSNDEYSVMHRDVNVCRVRLSQRGTRLGVYLDYDTNVLSFYRVSSESQTLLHSFRQTFKEPLCLVGELHSSRASIWIQSPTWTLWRQV